MPVPLQPFPRPALALLALAAFAGLLVSGLSWSPATDLDPQAGLVRMDGWRLKDLLAHLESRGLGLRAFPTGKGHAIFENAFLVRGERTWQELNGLIKDPKWLPKWKGVVYCEREGKPKGVEAGVECWGGACLVAHPFVFFGDPDLLAQIRSALSAERPAGS
jgi:hypothetical protein